MSTTTDTIVWCDGSFPGCLSFQKTYGDTTLKARRVATGMGWVALPNQQDLCPSCASKVDKRGNVIPGALPIVRE